MPVNAGREAARAARRQQQPVPRILHRTQEQHLVGRDLSASAAPAQTAPVPPAPKPTPALSTRPATALGHFGIAGSFVPTQNSPARIGTLRALSQVIQRGMDAIRDALVALFKGNLESTNGRRPTSPGPPDDDGCWDEHAPIDAVLLELRKRQRRRFL